MAKAKKEIVLSTEGGGEAGIPVRRLSLSLSLLLSLLRRTKKSTTPADSIAQPRILTKASPPRPEQRASKGSLSLVLNNDFQGRRNSNGEPDDTMSALEIFRKRLK